jgi:hypothetical protein
MLPNKTIFNLKKNKLLKPTLTNEHNKHARKFRNPLGTVSKDILLNIQLERYYTRVK